MSGPDERLDGALAEAFVAASLAVARRHASSPTYFEAGLAALAEAVAERPTLPAPTLVFDLVPLLSGERLLGPPAGGAGALDDALRAWDDHVLARLVADRRFSRLVDAVATLPKSLRPVAAGVASVRLLERLGVGTGVGLSAALVRRLSGRPAEELVEAGRAALADERVASRLAQGLLTVAKAARRSRELLSDAELFLVENIAALKGLGPRVALAQLADVAQTIEERLPARIRASQEDGDAPTALEEESAYPVGGFANLTTQGSLENLVSSELIYMDDAGAPRPDLFDLRFVEGELLYYSRDESVAVRKRRQVTLVLDASLSKARVLDGGEAVQRAVWLLGALTAVVRKLSGWLAQESLSFELVVPGPEDASPLLEERDVLALVLKQYKERGQLEVLHADSSVVAVKAARQRSKGHARVLVFGTSMPSGLEGDAQAEAFVDVAAPSPVVHWVDGRRAKGEVEGGAAERFTALAEELLLGLMHSQRTRPVGPLGRR
jgi:hypothetical protein